MIVTLSNGELCQEKRNGNIQPMSHAAIQRKQCLVSVERLDLIDCSHAGAARPSDKRQQPMPVEGEPHKIARISQSNPRSETQSAHPVAASHASWYRAPILIQQRSNPEPGEIAHLPVRTPSQPLEPPR